MEKVSCDVCGRKFKTNEALSQHRNDAHKEQPVHHHQRKSKITKGKILLILIPLLVVGAVGYGIYWSLSNSPNIGPVGSTHIHADIGIHLNGEEITPLPPQFYVRSSYVHIEEGPGAGTVTHIHSTGVPLKMFFDSLGMRFNLECFEVTGAKKYCNSGSATLKMYIKHADGAWEQNSEYEKYVFKDLDKILITYGDETDEEIALQQNNVTDFSKDNSGRTMVLNR
ncbi:MAG: hypothetical protein HYT70_04725 [Candidatus Aenigmarchaeota archaeon]|nr:hypothetical protein [Candidatus Aenigmarchaeota archaeon]